MSKRVKTIILFLSTLAIIACTACGSQEEEANIPTDEEMIASQYNDLISAFPEKTSEEEITDYIHQWANKHDIDNYYSGDILILSRNPSKGYKEKESVSLVTEITGDNPINEMQSLACLMYTINNLGKHPAVYAAIIPQDSINSIPEEICNTGSVINLQYSDKPAYYSSGYAASEITLKSSISYQSSRYDTAYSIKIKGLTGGLINNIEDAHPNPLLSINSFLTGLKNNGIVYDLAIYKTDSSFDRYLNGASATIVISSSDEEKFIKKLDKYVENFKEKWTESNGLLEITYKKVEVPSKVFEAGSEENLTAVLYTELTGICGDEDADEIETYVNIGGLRIKDGDAVIKLKAYGNSDSQLRDTKSQIRTLAKMSDYSFHQKEYVSAWDSDLIESLNNTADASGITLPDESSIIRALPCAYIADRNSKSKIAAFGVDFDNWTDISILIKEYLK